MLVILCRHSSSLWPIVVKVEQAPKHCGHWYLPRSEKVQKMSCLWRVVIGGLRKKRTAIASKCTVTQFLSLLSWENRKTSDWVEFQNVSSMAILSKACTSSMFPFIPLQECVYLVLWSNVCMLPVPLYPSYYPDKVFSWQVIKRWCAHCLCLPRNEWGHLGVPLCFLQDIPSFTICSCSLKIVSYLLH